jgi:hypothetical protein
VGETRAFKLYLHDVYIAPLSTLDVHVSVSGRVTGSSAVIASVYKASIYAAGMPHLAAVATSSGTVVIQVCNLGQQPVTDFIISAWILS